MAHPAEHFQALKRIGHVSLPGRDAKAASHRGEPFMPHAAVSQHLLYVAPRSSQCKLRRKHLVLAEHVASGNVRHGGTPH